MLGTSVTTHNEDNLESDSLAEEDVYMKNDSTDHQPSTEKEYK